MGGRLEYGYSWQGGWKGDWSKEMLGKEDGGVIGVWLWLVRRLGGR